MGPISLRTLEVEDALRVIYVERRQASSISSAMCPATDDAVNDVIIYYLGAQGLLCAAVELLDLPVHFALLRVVLGGVTHSPHPNIAADTAHVMSSECASGEQSTSNH